jgi:hypothetical protein
MTSVVLMRKHRSAENFFNIVGSPLWHKTLIAAYGALEWVELLPDSAVASLYQQNFRQPHQK